VILVRRPSVQLLASYSLRSFLPYKCLAGNNYRGWPWDGTAQEEGEGRVPREICLPSREAIAPSIRRLWDQNGSAHKKATDEEPKGTVKASLAFLSRMEGGGMFLERMEVGGYTVVLVVG
jgi:hypothetical protein